MCGGLLRELRENMTNLRYLRKPDGTLVLQEFVCTNPVPNGQLVYIKPRYEWQDVPIIDEGEE
jgi:hypothetical protein